MGEWKGIKYVKKARMWVARKTFNKEKKEDLIFWCVTEEEAKAKLETL